MAIIPNQNLVQKAFEDQIIHEKHRPHIGMSELGGKCQRRIWYNWHFAWKKDIAPAQKRIFTRGNWEEVRFLDETRNTQMTITDVQLEITDETGHIKGHIDGIIKNVPGAEKTDHLLEIKTMNNKRYNNFNRVGLQQSDPYYYTQINQYMGYLKLSRCLFVVTNKDNEERSYNRFKFDKNNFNEYKRVGFSIITSEFPPPKIGEVTWIDCKFCPAKGICHKGQPIEKNCRTCRYANVEMGGCWGCQIFGRNLTIEEQRVGCDEYQKSEAFNDK